MRLILCSSAEAVFIRELRRVDFDLSADVVTESGVNCQHFNHRSKQDVVVSPRQTRILFGWADLLDMIVWIKGFAICTRAVFVFPVISSVVR